MFNKLHHRPFTCMCQAPDSGDDMLRMTLSLSSRSTYPDGGDRERPEPVMSDTEVERSGGWDHRAGAPSLRGLGIL